jgi:hypothetical protein
LHLLDGLVMLEDWEAAQEGDIGEAEEGSFFDDQFDVAVLSSSKVHVDGRCIAIQF